MLYRIHSRINIWTGNVIINWNHNKSMQATIHTMFVNEKIIRIYSFCPFSLYKTQGKYILREVLRHPKIPHSASPGTWYTIKFKLFNSIPKLAGSEKESVRQSFERKKVSLGKEVWGSDFRCVLKCFILFNFLLLSSISWAN